MKSLYLVLMVSALMLFVPVNRGNAERVLSVDIGKERIKAAIIDSEKLVPDDLKDVKVLTLNTKDYFPRYTDRLFDPAFKKSLMALLGEEFDSIYILIRQPAANLAEKLSERVHKPVTVERTAIGTMDGLLLASWVSGHEIAYPVARVDFGKHISVGYAANPSDEGELKFKNMHANWRELLILRPDHNMKGWATRMHGKHMKRNHPGRNDWESKLGINRLREHGVQNLMSYRFEQARTGKQKKVNYMVRSVNKFLQLVVPEIEVAMNGAHLKTLVIGGGYANLLAKEKIDLGANYKDTVIILLNQEQRIGDVDPDLIPLLGAFAHRGVKAQSK